MKIKQVNEYTKNGKTQFVYAVDGTKEELAKYKTVKGEFYREHEGTGKPLFFSQDSLPNGTGTLKFKRDGDGVFIDRSEMAKNISLVNQYPGAIGEALAKQIASNILGNKTVSASAPVQVEQPEEETEE